MYLGMVLILVGLALLLGTLSPFAVCVAFALLLCYRFVRVEERMLADKFGAEWQNYSDACPPLDKSLHTPRRFPHKSMCRRGVMRKPVRLAISDNQRLLSASTAASTPSGIRTTRLLAAPM